MLAPLLALATLLAAPGAADGPPAAAVSAPPGSATGAPAAPSPAPAAKATGAGGPAAPRKAPAPRGAAKAPTAAEARAFVERVDAEYRRLALRQSTADWVAATYITLDTERLSAWANADLMAFLSGAIRESLRFRGVAADPSTARQLEKLRLVTEPPPAPSDPARRAALAEVATRLPALYGAGKWCGKDGKGPCLDLGQLEERMARSRSWDELLDAWVGWRTVSPPMRPLYERLVALSNEGAREIGFADVGEQWRAAFDMPPDAFAAETERLWTQLRPLYEALHCYVRGRLQEAYGNDRVPDGAPIPAHLLGNMWAQTWDNVYPLVEPHAGVAPLDVDAALKAQGWDPVRMVRTGEAFFSGLGFAPLPETFWERSMLAKPRDREVVCHASAWDVDAKGDLRVKMCIRPTEEDLLTVHHELGHNYYQRAAEHLPFVLNGGANEGFHEAIGDALVLSVTPEYLKRLGLVAEVPADERGVVNVQMRRALAEVAFLPFGLLMDRWRWDVFAGRIGPERYNAAWWELVRRLQGVAPPVPRSEADFDPGAKFHVPANVPYTRYFLARVLQFQFHRAMCRIAGHAGPLHACSVAGNREAGRRFGEMLSLGASRPWPDALEALTGERRMDASAMLEYFAPLRRFLDERNQGRRCGW
jgi:peptidyl-dipeptidase A